ncbi:DUF3899 domain-containing protein [Calditerricola satsumensis]|uniref:DUF3899 domain-containing protein n=2 Tax=Calditerricola satsumensis TaxID=373054 RepID=A0A8J3F9J5_9BACI|nr:DUF3899 domain-containing protein [Calditerricola satsumensis]GGJ93090.1 hypothetical protein GCM10007043_03490 [Calditerricola satsumensis]
MPREPKHAWIARFNLTVLSLVLTLVALVPLTTPAQKLWILNAAFLIGLTFLSFTAAAAIYQSGFLDAFLAGFRRLGRAGSPQTDATPNPAPIASPPHERAQRCARLLLVPFLLAVYFLGLSLGLLYFFERA